MATIRSWCFGFALTVWTAFFGPVIVVLIASQSAPPAIRKATRIWASGILVLLRWIARISYREQGRENIPAVPCLIMCNHQSMWETIAALVLFPDVAIILKNSLVGIPVLGWFLRHSPMIIVDRDSYMAAVRRMMTEGAQALASGRSVLIFPEGTRKSPGDTIEFRRGIEILYRTLSVPVLPVVVNSGGFWGAGLGNMTPGTITVSYMPVIQPHLNLLDFASQGEKAMQAEQARQAA